MDTHSYIILNLTRQTSIATQIRLADTARARRIGLVNHTHLEKGEGLLIQPRRWLPLIVIHTIRMKFPIDIFFLDKNKRVLEICTLPPNRVACVLGVRWVLETAEGTIVTSSTQENDQIEFVMNP